MDFESPDVEKEFPGLYSSEAVRKNNESDFSDDSHEKSFKSDLIGKRKEKKDSKKDRGYAALEGESSQDEGGDSKSPSKSKKTKSFKFPVKKSEKREKSRDKEVKEREKEVEKDKKKEKDKKEKSKQKEKKKCKPGDEGLEVEEYAVFGVPLAKAVERLGCLDGVGIPLPVRHCIDCIHACGLSSEGLYKTAGVKTKIQALKKSYNSREPVSSVDMDIPLAANLLITFLKESPEHILTSELVARFEEAGAAQDVAQREEELSKLLKQLPECNQTLLAWLIVHFDHVTQHEKLNKLNAQSIAMTFSPVLQMSHRLLAAFLCHCKALFTDTTIHKYIPPLAPGSTFPEAQKELDIELRKQEALLNQIHKEMSEGFVCKSREEQLWEVQRIVTQLKRKLRSLQKTQEASIMQKSLDEESLALEESKLLKEKAKTEVEKDKLTSKPEVKQIVRQKATDENSPPKTEPPSTPPKVEAKGEQPKIVDAVATPAKEVLASASEQRETSPIVSPVQIVQPVLEFPVLEQSSKPLTGLELRLQLENIELHQLHAKLQDRLDHERRLAQKFRAQIETYRGFVDSDSDESSAGSTPAYLSPETEAKLEQLIEENHQFTAKRDELVRRIMEEKEACIKLAVSINFLEMTNKAS